MNDSVCLSVNFPISKIKFNQLNFSIMIKEAAICTALYGTVQLSKNWISRCLTRCVSHSHLSSQS